MKINENKLRDAIIQKYDSQAKFAKAAGLSDPQVSNGIKTQTVHFLNACRKAGIDLDLLNEEESTKKNNLSLRLKLAETRVKELETLLEQKDNIIKSYETIFQNRFNEKK
jgi:isocitrate dehydrogenase